MGKRLSVSIGFSASVDDKRKPFSVSVERIGEEETVFGFQAVQTETLFSFRQSRYNGETDFGYSVSVQNERKRFSVSIEEGETVFGFHRVFQVQSSTDGNRFQFPSKGWE